ncbi:hypothetical protein FA13DRAFT_996355 [Coprinellus micaceus]|uniref:Uncharacterized protein n=1 Tax=Coprinellus micaceus TaxID=71717 RepID=A0A4Y7SYA7_COPMI|nr:hypothetical protein FA13DRAFT_996355 [Coprinellus micaceus]
MDKSFENRSPSPQRLRPQTMCMIQWKSWFTVTVVGENCLVSFMPGKFRSATEVRSGTHGSSPSALRRRRKDIVQLESVSPDEFLEVTVES